MEMSKSLAPQIFKTYYFQLQLLPLQQLFWTSAVLDEAAIIAAEDVLAAAADFSVDNVVASELLLYSS